MDNISELATALAKAQAAMQPAIKDSKNPHFNSKYADLASIWNAARAALTANGLSVVQLPVTGPDGAVGVRTILLHSSGQCIESEPLYAPMSSGKDGKGMNIQQLGSALTYLRRYSLASVVGIAPDDDDDGQAAAQTARHGASYEPPAPPPAPAVNGRFTTVKALMDRIRSAGLTAPTVTPAQVRDMAEAEYAAIIQTLEAALLDVAQEEIA